MITGTKRRRRGLEVLEAVGTLPVMLLILVGIVNLGIAVYARQAVTNAANFGARMGSVSQGCRSCAAYSAAQEAVDKSLLRDTSVTILAPGGSVGTVLRIRVTGRIPNLMGPLLAFNGVSWSEPIEVTGEATFRAEGW